MTQFHIRNWSLQGKCSNVHAIINVVEEMYRVQRKTGNNPVVVHCRLALLSCLFTGIYPLSFSSFFSSDTVSRSGMFCAVATNIDCCKTESVVDVFQVVKAQRIQKPGLVHTVVGAHVFNYCYMGYGSVWVFYIQKMVKYSFCRCA